jgi:hypothetical protein
MDTETYTFGAAYVGSVGSLNAPATENCLTLADIKKFVESLSGATVKPYDSTAWNGADLADLDDFAATSVPVVPPDARDIIYVCPECHTYRDDYVSSCPCLTEGIQCHMGFVPDVTPVALSLAEMGGYIHPAVKQLAEEMSFKLGASINAMVAATADLTEPDVDGAD